MLRIFTPVKIQRPRPGLKPQTWVPEAKHIYCYRIKELCIKLVIETSLYIDHPTVRSHMG